jgi:D-3-phosphoglycerate dehydrogenase
MNDKGKVLVTDSVHNVLIEGLQNAGFFVDYNVSIGREEVKTVIDQFVGIVVNTRMYMDKEMMDLAPQLKFIARVGSGLDIIDQVYARSIGIHVISSPEGNCNAVAEHALGMLLSLSNNLHQGDREVRNFKWQREKNRGWELEGKTIGIIGYGHTGRSFAKKLSGFDVNVLAYDKYKKHFADETRYVDEVTLERLKEGSDVISLHVPLTSETRRMIDESFLNSCKTGVLILNTSRGGVVDTAALIGAMEAKNVGGAALDVFENEKPHTMSAEEKKMYEKLFSFDNSIYSPHVAGWTVESKRKLAEILLRKICELG